LFPRSIHLKTVKFWADLMRENTKTDGFWSF
jgi:hypothetical protein